MKIILLQAAGAAALTLVALVIQFGVRAQFGSSAGADLPGYEFVRATAWS